MPSGHVGAQRKVLSIYVKLIMKTIHPQGKNRELSQSWDLWGLGVGGGKSSSPGLSVTLKDFCLGKVKKSLDPGCWTDTAEFITYWEMVRETLPPRPDPERKNKQNILEKDRVLQWPDSKARHIGPVKMEA